MNNLPACYADLEVKLTVYWVVSVVFAVQTPAGAEESSKAAEILESNQEEIW